MDTRSDQSQEISDGAMMPKSANPDMATLGEVSGTPILTEGASSIPPASPTRESFQRLFRDKRSILSIGIIAFFILLALIGPIIYEHIGGPYVSDINSVTYGPQDYHSFSHEELDRQNELPSRQYWLGTDQLGRDILARLMQGILISLTVALLVEVIDVVLGVLVGVLAGYFGGWIDTLLARFADLMFAFPGLLLVILISGIFGSAADTAFSHIPVIGGSGDARLILVSLALAVTAWPLMARYVRGQTLQLKEQQFIEAARTSGTSNLRIIWRHIIPNLFSIVIVVATLDISTTIVGEAGISLLGLGVQPPGSSIGLMIATAAVYIDSYPWEVIIPCVTLALIVIAFSFMGDSLRDAFDPRSKN